MPTASSRTDSPASERVVERVAAAEGVAPTELEARLYDAVDADALDALVAGGSAGLAVEFEFRGYAVEVRRESATTVSVHLSE